MNKKLIRLTEGDLHKIVKESVNRVIMEEGMFDNLGNKLQGAYNGMKQGFSKGQNQMNDDNFANNANQSSAMALRSYATKALNILNSSGNVQAAIKWLQDGLNWDKYYGHGKVDQPMNSLIDY